MTRFSSWYNDQKRFDEALPPPAARSPRSDGPRPWEQNKLVRGAIDTWDAFLGRGRRDWEGHDKKIADDAAAKAREDKLAAMKGTSEDREVQRKKAERARAVFRKTIQAKINEPVVNQAAKRPIAAIARALTMGGPILPMYAVQIMQAVHAVADDDNAFEVAKAYFDDPAEVLQMLQQAFIADQQLWYDYDKGQKYHPNIQFDANAMQSVRQQWQNAPERKKSSWDDPDASVSSIAKSMEEWLATYPGKPTVNDIQNAIMQMRQLAADKGIKAIQMTPEEHRAILAHASDAKKHGYA